MSEILTLEAQQDAHIRSDLSARENDNYGQQQTLLVGTGRQPIGEPDAIRSLLQFDLSTLPNAPIGSAVLELTVFDFNNGSPSTQYQVDVHRILGPWQEGNGYEGPGSSLIGAPPGAVWVDDASGVAWTGSDPNNQDQPAFEATVVDSVSIDRGTTASGDVIQWDITSLVNDWASGAPNFGMMLTDETTDGTFRTIGFGSREGDSWDFPGTSPSPVTGPRLLVIPASLTVDTLVDEDDGDLSPGDVSLREAIKYVADGGVVDFDPSITGDNVKDPTIKLSLGELVVDKNITIDGPGANKLTVSGEYSSRVFRIDDDDPNNSIHVVIDGLKIAKGNGLPGTSGSPSPADIGGAIFNVENLSVEYSTISDSFAETGGGIANRGTLSVAHSTIKDNMSLDGGGGLFNDGGIVEIDGSVISHNRTHLQGGGIENTGTMTISDSTISYNHSTGSSFPSPLSGGGGIGNNGGQLTVVLSTLEGNTAADRGGGIFSHSGTLDVIDTTLAHNSAVEGGGISNGEPTGGWVNVINSTLFGNSADKLGGGIENSFNAGAVVTNSTLSGNEAEQGGGVYHAGTGFSLYSSTVADNTASVQGGGLRNNGPRFFVGNSIVATNTNDSDVSGDFVSQGYNLIGSGDGGSGFINGVNDDIVGTSANPVNPLIEPLADNGGPTKTHALLNRQIEQLYRGGRADNFSLANGVERARPSSGLVDRLQEIEDLTPTVENVFPLMDFDEPDGNPPGERDINRFFAHTFSEPPQGTYRSASLEIRMKPNGELSFNDVIELSFTDENGNLIDLGWSEDIGTLAGTGWNVSNIGGGQTFNLDLSNLPSGGTTVNLLPQLGQSGFLDVVVADDTSVDYMKLVVRGESRSPAIDAANPNDFPATDQRGVPRPQGSGPDIGAYEFKAGDDNTGPDTRSRTRDPLTEGGSDMAYHHEALMWASQPVGVEILEHFDPMMGSSPLDLDSDVALDNVNPLAEPAGPNYAMAMSEGDPLAAMAM
ncbi:MAG: DNRLRE domain-containing protein [Cyanobacteria bacterium SBC]|nr:DNRLRE domain-containing protein [Cyanobacteria bacterium SBC]